MLSPNTRIFLISLVFVFLLVFLISPLLEISVGTTTFGDPFCRLFPELIVGNLSQEFSLVICVTWLKTSLQWRLLGEFNFMFPFDYSRTGITIEREH